jgi:hypothetical protein
MKQNTTKMSHGILWNRSTFKRLINIILHGIVESILLYGSESWPRVGKIRKIRTVKFEYFVCLQATRQNKPGTKHTGRKCLFLYPMRNLKVCNPKMAFTYQTNEGQQVIETCVALVISSKKKRKRRRKKKKAAKYKWKINSAHYRRWRLRWRLWALKTKTNEGF